MSAMPVPMFGADGQVYQVPSDQVPTALANQGKLAVRIHAEGNQYYVPHDKLHDALAAGGKTDLQIQQPQQNQDQYPASIVGSGSRFLGGIGNALAGTAKSLYTGATSGPFGDNHPVLNVLAHGSPLLMAKQAFIDPQVDQAKQAITGAQSPDLSTRIQSGGHAIAAMLPGIGPLLAGTSDAIRPDIENGNYAGAAGKVAATAGMAELTRRGINAITPVPTNLSPAEIAARNVAKAILPKGSEVDTFTDALGREKGNIEQYAAKNGLTTRTPMDASVAARQSADDLNGNLYDRQILGPNANVQTNIPMNFEDVGSRGINGSRTATLGQIDKRITHINALTSPGESNAMMGDTLADRAKMADLISEGKTLSDILHQGLGKATGLDPNAIAGIRRSIGARYEVADQLGKSANDTLLTAGKGDRTGSTIKAPTLASTGIDLFNKYVRGGPEQIANRAFQKTYPKLNVPAGVGNPASLEELKSAGIAQYLKRR